MFRRGSGQVIPGVFENAPSPSDAPWSRDWDKTRFTWQTLTGTDADGNRNPAHARNIPIHVVYVDHKKNRPKFKEAAFEVIYAEDDAWDIPERYANEVLCKQDLEQYKEMRRRRKEPPQKQSTRLYADSLTGPNLEEFEDLEYSTVVVMPPKPKTATRTAKVQRKSFCARVCGCFCGDQPTPIKQKVKMDHYTCVNTSGA